MEFLERLALPRPILLDGPTGTELDRRGVDTSLPLWSARALIDAPDAVRRIHRDYREAGAEVLTANTFRTHARSLRPAGLDHEAASLTLEAVEIAREVAGEVAATTDVWVAGSQAPLEDCYEPSRAPDDHALRVEHEAMAEALARSGVDLILVETHNTIREARAATRAATATGLPVVTSFVCDAGGRLLSGESLTEAVQAVLPFDPCVLGANCSPVPSIASMLDELRRAAPDVPLGAWGNAGRPDPVKGWVATEAEDREAYADHAERWIERGARLVGSCCGTTPEHVAALRRRIDAAEARAAARSRGRDVRRLGDATGTEGRDLE